MYGQVTEFGKTFFRFRRVVRQRGRIIVLDLAERMALRHAAAGWSDRVDMVAAQCDEQAAPADAFLIRPDGCVAWVAAAQDADDEAERQLRYALTTWFGPQSFSGRDIGAQATRLRYWVSQGPTSPRAFEPAAWLRAPISAETSTPDNSESDTLSPCPSIAFYLS
jgi:hypothetical protein